MAIAPEHYAPQHQREAVLSGADQAGLAPEGYQQLDEQGELPAWQEFQEASDGQAEADDASSWTSSEAEGADTQQISGLCCASILQVCALQMPFSLHVLLSSWLAWILPAPHASSLCRRPGMVCVFCPAGPC